MEKLILTLLVFLLINTKKTKSEFVNIDINKYQICKLQKTEEQQDNKIKVIKEKRKQISTSNNFYTVLQNDTFFDRVELIKKYCAEYNIPYQAIVWLWWRESNWGNSYGAKKDNVHFGVKCHGKKGVMYKDDCVGKCCFVSYANFEQSLKDLMSFLKRNKRYSNAGLYEAKTAEQVVKALFKANYATDPNFLNIFYKEFKEMNLENI